MKGHQPLPYGLSLSIFDSFSIKNRPQKIKKVKAILPTPKIQSQTTSITEHLPLISKLIEL